jgi:hypothetical protein
LVARLSGSGEVLKLCLQICKATELNSCVQAGPPLIRASSAIAYSGSTQPSDDLIDQTPALVGVVLLFLRGAGDLSRAAELVLLDRQPEAFALARGVKRAVAGLHADSTALEVEGDEDKR